MLPPRHYAVDTEIWRRRIYYKNRKGNWFNVSLLRKGTNKRFDYFIKTVCSNCQDSCFVSYSNKKCHNNFCGKLCFTAFNKGVNHHSWRGGRTRKGGINGYIRIYSPDHPNASRGYVPEHRLVMEKVLGRFLLKTEFVHHIDCDKQNNSTDNLVLVSNWQHNRAHASLEGNVKGLLKLGVLRFNRKDSKYEIVPRH